MTFYFRGRSLNEPILAGIGHDAETQLSDLIGGVAKLDTLLTAASRVRLDNDLNYVRFHRRPIDY